MELKRFSIRFNFDDPDDLRAWNYLHRHSDRVVSKEIIDAINRACDLSDAEKMVRRVISEELEKALKGFSFEQVKDDPETENSIMDFLESF
jgi:HEAT repeat protein